MRRVAALLAVAALFWTAADAGRAQAADTPQAIYDGFNALLGGRDQREIYALPPERYWRATGPLRIRLAGGRGLGLGPALMALADDFRSAAGVEIGVQSSALAIMPAAGQAGDLTVLIVARPLGAEFAAGLGVDAEMRERFADGRWPVLFRFHRDDLSETGRRNGIVLLAEDLKSAEIEAWLAMAMIWTMGGASIGDDLGSLVDMAGRPGLTGLGRRVFALMYDPVLTLGQPLDEVRAAARRLLEIGEAKKR